MTKQCLETASIKIASQKVAKQICGYAPLQAEIEHAPLKCIDKANIARAMEADGYLGRAVTM